MSSKKIKYYLFITLFVFASVGALNYIWAEGDGLDVHEGTSVGHSTARSFPAPISMESVESQLGDKAEALNKGEINFVYWDELQNSYTQVKELEKVPGNKEFTILIKNRNDEKTLYFYAYYVDNKNKVKSLIPAEKNKIEAEGEYQGTEKFSKGQGVEKLYFVVSKSPIKIAKPSKGQLDNVVKKYKKESKNGYIGWIKDPDPASQINEKPVQPILIWFKNAFAKKIVFINKGNKDNVADSVRDSAKKELINEEAKILKEVKSE